MSSGTVMTDACDVVLKRLVRMFVRPGRQTRVAIGASMRQKRAHRPYPRDRAASMIDRGMVSMPERKASVASAPPKRLSEIAAQAKALRSGTDNPVDGSVTLRPRFEKVK